MLYAAEWLVEHFGPYPSYALMVLLVVLLAWLLNRKSNRGASRHDGGAE